MDEIENKMAVQEIATPEVSPQESATTENIIETLQEDPNEKNIRALRLGKKEAERRATELERKSQMQEELLARLMSNQNMVPHQAEEEDEFASIPADDYIPKGKVEKLIQRAEKKAEKIAQDAIEKVLADRERAQFHSKLKTKFSDFDEVVTPETLEILEQQDPELATTIADLKDPYKIGLQSYKYIKSMNLAEKAPAARRTKEVDKKLEENSKTVQSPQAFDKRPMAQTFQLTEANKQALWKEMNDYAGLAGSVPNM